MKVQEFESGILITPEMELAVQNIITPEMQIETQNILDTEFKEDEKIWAILSDYTAEELAFIIDYYDDLGSLYDCEKLLAELIEMEERIPGITFGSFNDMMETCYKVGVGGKKTKVEKMAQQIRNKYIDPKEFFILTKEIYSQEPTVLIYMSRKILGVL
jgi:hypothetical protein